MTTKNTAVQIIPAELSPVLKDTKLELSKAESHAMAFAPSMATYLELAETIKGLDKINPTEIMAKQAREARLKMVKVRTAAEEIKDLRKEGIRAEGDLIQALFNVVKNSCIVTETEFTEIEKHQERKEAERQAALCDARIELLATFGTDTTYLPLGIMTDEQFNRLLETETITFNARKKAVEEAEAKRIEDERLAEEARQAAAKKDAEEREAQRLENIRLQKENTEKEALLTKEREAAAKEAKRLADIAEAERKQRDAELAKEREASAKLAAELQAQKDTKDKAEQEEKERIEAEEAEKLAAQKAKELAPDKDKINALYISLKDLPLPIVSTKEADLLVTGVAEKIRELLMYIKAEAKKLS